MSVASCSAQALKTLHVCRDWTFMRATGHKAECLLATANAQLGARVLQIVRLYARCLLSVSRAGKLAGSLL